MIKKTLILIADLLISGIACGQSSFDFLLRAKALTVKGESANAVAMLTKAIGEKQESRLYVERAEAYLLEGDYLKAINDFNTANSLESHSGDYGLARIYALRGKRENAAEVLSELRGSYKDHEEVIYAGAMLSLSYGKTGDAVISLTGILASDHGDEKYLRLLAKAQTYSSNWAGASVASQTLLDMEIPDAGLLLSRAECYSKTSEADKAMTDVNRYLSLYPGDKTALSMAGRIKTAAGDHLKALQYFL